MIDVALIRARFAAVLSELDERELRIPVIVNGQSARS
jgi:hypothetical protein